MFGQRILKQFWCLYLFSGQLIAFLVIKSTKELLFKVYFYFHWIGISPGLNQFWSLWFYHRVNWASFLWFSGRLNLLLSPGFSLHWVSAWPTSFRFITLFHLTKQVIEIAKPLYTFVFSWSLFQPYLVLCFTTLLYCHITYLPHICSFYYTLKFLPPKVS